MEDENTPLSVSRGSNEGLGLDNAVLRIDKGRVTPPSAADEEPRAPRPEHIPWGYGHDRITAMIVDPNRLYIYWELTDQAIESARPGLGSGSKDAWLSLRVYDITGRIFDGTNAHSYFDIKVDRSDRQWFIHIGKPASTHLVEIGLKSHEGFFVKIVRSGRADFPRFEPSPDGTVEWLTVRAGGPVGHPTRGTPPSADSAGDPSTGPGAPGGPGGPGTQTGPADGAARGAGGRLEGSAGFELRDWSWSGWEQLFQTEWIEGRRFLEWSTPVLRTTWEAGPFPLPVELPTVIEEHFEGPVTVYPLEGGRTRIVYGPWQVTIKGIGARAEARVLSRWEMEASWVVNVGFERIVRELLPAGARAPGEIASGAMLGSSEALGASERRWLSASELRLRGASELHLLGASELRMRGASEIVLGAASETRILGGSERVFWGASEYRLGGASEIERLGASERIGASEKRLGASELYAGASEGVTRSPYSIEDAESSALGRG